MSVLSNKRVLVVDSESAQLSEVASMLTSEGVEVESLPCSEVTPEKVAELDIDLVLLNHLHEGVACNDTLALLRSVGVTAVMPILVQVDDTTESIQTALSSGAADYTTPDEPAASVIQKMRAIFDQGDTFAGSSDIDITPTETTVTKTGIRVYVVEDDPLLRNLLSVRMEKSSFPYEFSVDGSGALEAMHQFKPDIIILDLMLPGKSGFEVLQEVKADEMLKDVPVIVFSNKDGQEDRARAKQLGAAGFYVKAMTDLSELIDKIAAHAKA